MIEFLNEITRTNFHLLPIEKQMEVQKHAEYLVQFGKIIKVMFVDPESSEVSIRIYKKFDISG